MEKHIRNPKTQNLKEKLSQEVEDRNLRELPAKAFNRVWDNEVDAETWDNWRPPDDRP